MNIEPLEPRIAPAVVIDPGNPKLATYTDVDGDSVRILISKGAFNAGDFTSVAMGSGDQLQRINLSDDAGEFVGAKLTITATRGPTGGDGFANVGYINSTGFDLGAVSVDGDLGQIDAGDATTATTGLASLTVQSLGRYDVTTQAAGGSLLSTITGKLTTLKVHGDLMGTINVAGGADGDLGNATIAGSLIGGFNAGALTAAGDIGRVSIGGDLVGGGRFDSPVPGITVPVPSGLISADGRIAGVTVKGSLLGHFVAGSASISAGAAGIGSVTVGGDLVGGGSDSARITGGVLGAVRIGGNIFGGNGPGGSLVGGAPSLNSSGLVVGAASIGSVFVGGSIFGGSPGAPGTTSSLGDCGGILCFGPIGSITVRGSIVGGDASDDDSLSGSGFIVGGRIRAVTIGGSILSGTDGTSGGFDRNGSIRAADDIGTLTVKGSLVGNATHPVIITAEGAPTPTATTDVAMKTITIAGRVERAEILAGYNTSRMPVNANAQIGSVTAGSWIASDLVAGVQDGGDGFGDGTDNQIGGAPSGVDPIARIASITIKGQVLGTLAGGDKFGFVAEHIVSFKVGGTVIPLVAGPNSNFDFDRIGTTDDVRVVEVL